MGRRIAHSLFFAVLVAVAAVCSLGAVAATSGSSAGAPAAVARSSAGAAPAVSVSKIRGGPEVIFDERPGSSAVCIMVAVPAGSSFETADTRGAAHLIEHLAFDGSERYSREEMSGWVDDVGGFLNAFTRKETTVYFLLVSSAHMEKGMEVLSQMLLHSVFRPEEIEKERKVIIEEIRRETDDPRAARERIVDRCLYRGSALAEPVIGFPSTIETMSADDVKAFYRAHYAPENMRIMLIGGFDAARATRLIEDYFTAGSGARNAEKPGADMQHPANLNRGAPPEPRWCNEITVYPDASHEGGLDLLVPFPSVDENSFPAAVIVSQMLEGDTSPLVLKCKEASLPEPEISLELYRGFSALHVHIGAGEGAAVPYRAVPGIVESLADWKPTKEAVDEARLSFHSSEVFDREMYHFYVMAKGEPIALFGDRYISQCTSGIEKVTEKDCVRFLKGAFRPLTFNACLIESEEESVAPKSDTGAPVIETLSNGCTVAAVERPGSPVAALHLLIKGRACCEGEPSHGLAEMLMTLYESSSAGEALSKQLEALGARVQYGDNPYVPQDDYLLSPAYAVIRLEAPAQAVEEAAWLLVKHLLESRFTSEDGDAAKMGIAREVGMRSGSPNFIVRTAMMAELLKGHPYASSIFPARRLIMQASLDEIESLRARLLVGGAVVATLVSPNSPANGCEMLSKLLGRLPQGSMAECPSIPDSARAASIDTTSKKEGAYLAAGWLAKSSSLSETASFLVAGEILSRRMQLELREKQGLAYSIDCGVTPLPGGAVVVAQLGTGAPRLKEAQDALEKEISGMGDKPPDAAEVAIARNRILGKRTRSELSSINQAYVLGLDIFLGGAAATGGAGSGGVGGARESGARGYSSLESLIGAVTADEAKKAAQRLFSWDRAVVLRLAPESARGH